MIGISNQHSVRKPIRIIYLHQYFKTPLETGGTRSYEFSRRLVKKGYEVHVVTANEQDNGGGWTHSVIDGVHVHSCNVPYSNHLGFGARIKAFLSFAVKAGSRARRLNGDVIFATSTPLTIVLPALHASIFRRVPIVFEVRDLWPKVPIAMGILRNPLIKRAAKVLEEVAYIASKEIVALSEGMAEGVRDVVNGRRPVTVIPNASDLELFASVEPHDVAAWRAARSWLGERRLVVYAGTLGEVNNVSYFVRLAYEVGKLDDSVRFLVVGDGKELLLLKSLAQEFGVLNRNLFFEPPVSKKNLPVVLAASTLTTSFVLPIKELEANSANKFFDSLAASRPIVINHGGWQSDVISAAGAGLSLDPYDLPGSARQVVAALQNTSFLAKASAAARHLAETRYDRDLLFDRFEEVLLDAYQPSRV